MQRLLQRMLTKEKWKTKMQEKQRCNCKKKIFYFRLKKLMLGYFLFIGGILIHIMSSPTNLQEEDDIPNNEPHKEISCKKKSTFTINKEMWRFKLHYFLFFGNMAMTYPFVPDFGNTRIGISTSALAFLFMAQQFILIFTKPLIGYLADYFNNLKEFLCGLTILQGICFILLLFIPKIELNLDSNSGHDPEGKTCVSVFNVTNQVEFQNLSSLFNISHIDSIDLTKNITDFSIDNDNKFKECSMPWNYLATSEQKSTIEYCEFSYDFNYSFCEACPFNTTDESTYACYFQTKFCFCVIKNNTRVNWNCNCFGNSNKFLEPKISKWNSHRIEMLTYQFWMFVILHTAVLVCGTSVITLSDTACYESVEKTKSDFGRQRLWGAIGWGLMAPIAGLMNDYMGSYLASWIIMQCVTILVIWNLIKLELTVTKFSKNILKDVGTVLKSKEVILFEIGVFMNGIGVTIVWTYFVLFLLSIGASKMLCGLAITVQSCFGTIPMMFFSSVIIEKIGHQKVQSLAMLMYFIRFLSYSYLYDPWLVLLIESLHGITYGLVYADIASFGKANSKPGTEATTQSVLFSTHEGIGGGIGCVFVGLGLDLLGDRQTFFVASLFMICGSLLHFLSDLLMHRKKKPLESVQYSSVSVVT